VKLLLDENLSRRLIGQVADLFPGTVHVSSVNLLQASDVEVWEYAKLFALCIVTADGDFYELSITMGAPPKVVWLKVAIIQRLWLLSSFVTRPFELPSSCKTQSGLS